VIHDPLSTMRRCFFRLGAGSLRFTAPFHRRRWAFPARAFLLGLSVWAGLPLLRADAPAPVWLPQVNHWAANTGGKGGTDANADVISNMICDMAVLNAGDLDEQFAKYAPLVITKSYWDETNWADGAYSAGKRVSKGEFFNKNITFDSSTFGGITATIAHPHVLDTDHSLNDPNLTPAQLRDIQQLGAENQGISLAKYSDNLPYVALSDGRKITSIAYPTSVAFDRDGYLWVADNGPDQNFKIFSVPATGEPTVVATFGETGGVFAGPVSGRAGPLRFWGPRGVGFGDKGEIIVGCSGIPGQVQGGTDVRWFMPTDTSSLARRLATATLQHQARGMFLHVGDFAPGTNGTELHTESVRYTMDYSKKPGESWAFSAVTLDPFRYPDDPRAQMAFGTTYIKQIGGKKFLYCTDMYNGYIAVFRFEEGSEIAIPCAFFYCYFTGQGADWAAGKYPTWTEASSGWRYMWRDSNGNGQVEAGEFGTYYVANGFAECYDVDADGNIWMGGGQSEYSADFKCGGNWVIPCTGVDANGVPMYNLNAIEKLDVPQSLLRPEDYEISRSPTRMRYVPETDTLYLGVGMDPYYTRRIYVIDGYRHSGHPTLRCMIDAGFDSNRENEIHLDQGTVTMVLPMSFATDNEYVYVGYLTGGRDTLSRGEITVYSATDGHEVGWLRPDASTNWFCGTVDLVVGLQVTKLADGSRVICEEDDGAGKVMVFHWDPKAPPSNAMIITTARPAALTCSRDHDGTLQLATTGGLLNWSIMAAPVHGTATVSSAGLVRYTPTAGYVGLDSLIVQVTNAQGVRDSIKVACTVSAPTTATVTLGGLSQTYNGSSRPVTVTTVPSGLLVNVTYSGSSTAPVNAGSYSVVATVADATYTGSVSGTLNVAKASPSLTWSAPADITYGTALSSTQLNATASVPGTFTYTPAAGTVLHAGNAQTLQATFTPTDTVNYATATKSVTLSVAKAPLIAKATDQQRMQGTANPTLGISYTGFVNGDTAAALDALPTASTTATTASTAGQYPITLSGGSDADYAFTLQNGTLTISASNAPAAPILESVTASGISGKADAGSTVKVLRGTTSLGTTTANSSGAWHLAATLADGIYSLSAIATDAANNSTASSASTWTIDTTAPTVPAGVAASAVSSSAIALRWTASSDALGVVGYRIYRAGLALGTTPTPGYNDTGLTAGTSYGYTVTAYDAAGHESAPSESVTATTQVAGAQTLGVTDTAGLTAALATASANPSATYTITLAAGTYTPTSGLTVGAAGVTLQGNGAVVLSGAGLNTGPLLTITGDNVVLYNLTFAEAAGAVEIAAGADAGTVADCTFRHAGLSGAGCRDWAITGNAFNDLVGTSTSAAAAITFGGGADNLTITDNVIVGCDRGIALSALAGPKIRNNFIADGRTTGHPGAAITLAAVTASQVDNNSLYQAGSYANSIEYSGTGEVGAIRNTLANKPITATGTATATLAANVTSAQASWFAAPASGDLHLAGARSGVVDAGTTIPGLNVDIDGDARPSGSAYDIGADEAQADTLAPTVPSGLNAANLATNSVSLSWTASTDSAPAGVVATGVSGYRIYRNGTAVGVSTTTSYSDTGLVAGTTYSYTVTAYDGAANESAASAVLRATTTAMTTAAAGTDGGKSGGGGGATGLWFTGALVVLAAFRSLRRRA